MRTTDKMLETKLNQLNKLLGTPLKPYSEINGKFQANVGNIHVDSNLLGVQICRMHNEGGACSTPYGAERLSKGKCLAKLETIIIAVEIARAF